MRLCLGSGHGAYRLWSFFLALQLTGFYQVTASPEADREGIKRTGKRFRVNMISALSNAEMLRFRLFTGPSVARC
jgi:hypothetical protein